MKNLHVQIRVNEQKVASAVKRFLNSMPALEISTLESASASANPEIIIINDEIGRNGYIFSTLGDYARKFPDAAIFVVSEENSAERIVRIIKGGASEYFPLPLDFDQLRQSIEEVRTRTAAAGKDIRSSVYSFISSKGGLGATVLAVNTAVALIGRDTSVALCDLNLRTGDSSILLDLAPKSSIADLTSDFQRLDAALLKNAMAPHASGLELLAAPPRPGDSGKISSGQIKVIIAHLSKIYHRTVIDCPSGSPGELALEAMGSSDKIFIILDLSIPAIRNAVKLAREIQALGISDDRIEFIINRFARNSVIPVKEADRSLGRSAFWIFPNAYDEVFSSITSGMPIVSSHPRSGFSKNVRQFVEKLNRPQASWDFRGISNLFGKSV
jgi:pilus assembly protein CpaE